MLGLAFIAVVAVSGGVAWAATRRPGAPSQPGTPQDSAPLPPQTAGGGGVQLPPASAGGGGGVGGTLATVGGAVTAGLGALKGLGIIGGGAAAAGTAAAAAGGGGGAAAAGGSSVAGGGATAAAAGAAIGAGPIAVIVAGVATAVVSIGFLVAMFVQDAVRLGYGSAGAWRDLKALGVKVRDSVRAQLIAKGMPEWRAHAVATCFAWDAMTAHNVAAHRYVDRLLNHGLLDDAAHLKFWADRGLLVPQGVLDDALKPPYMGSLPGILSAAVLRMGAPAELFDRAGVEHIAQAHETAGAEYSPEFERLATRMGEMLWASKGVISGWQNLRTPFSMVEPETAADPAPARGWLGLELHMALAWDEERLARDFLRYGVIGGAWDASAKVVADSATGLRWSPKRTRADGRAVIEGA